MAIADYSEHIKTHNVDFRAYSDRAWCYFKLGKYVEAVADYDKAIEFNPNPPALYYYEKADVFYEIEEYEKALIELDNAIMVGSHYSKAYNLKAIILDLLQPENYAELALECYAEAIRISEKSNYYYNRARIYFCDLKYVSKAFEDYKKALELDPNDADYGNAYTKCRLELEKHHKVLDG